MRWDIERYVRVYKRDTAEWLCLSWQARGLFYELLRKADRDGTLAVGRLEPAQAVALLVRGTRADVAGPLAELLRDGCVMDVPAKGRAARHLLITNYREAQGEAASGAERTAKWRAGKTGVTPGDASDGCDARDEEPPSQAKPADPADPSPAAATPPRYPLAMRVWDRALSRCGTLSTPDAVLWQTIEDAAARVGIAACLAEVDKVADRQIRKGKPIGSLSYFVKSLHALPGANDPPRTATLPAAAAAAFGTQTNEPTL